MDAKYSCKQVQNLQPADDVLSTAEDTTIRCEDYHEVMKLGLSH